MDSRMQISSPSATICPSSATTSHTFAVISARISAMGAHVTRRPQPVSVRVHIALAMSRLTERSGGGSDGEDAVLARRAVDALVAAHAQPVPDRGAGVGRVDHVVELR